MTHMYPFTVCLLEISFTISLKKKQKSSISLKPFSGVFFMSIFRIVLQIVY